MNKPLFRNLTKDEIEVRVGQAYKNNQNEILWASLLLYKNARTDARIFDETFGPLNWQCSFRVVNDNLFCTISVWNPELGQWVAKEDVGVESNTAAEKGEASDAFKRAGYKFGCGVELYTAPFIQIKANKFVDPKGQYYDVSKMRYDVADIVVTEDKNITFLSIVDRYGTEVYRYGQKPGVAANVKADPETGEVKAIICEDCGKPILSHGSYSAEKIATSTKNTYGKSICWDCSVKRKEKKNA